MKAVKYYGVGDIKLVDLPKPVAGPGQAVVKIVYCGICGTDVHAYSMEGIFNWELVLGHEAVGIVEAIGEGVTCVNVGDRVAVGPPGDCGECYACNNGYPNTCVNAFPNTLGIGPGTQGAYAEYVLSKNPKNELFKIPEGLPFEAAVLFDVIGVGFHAVRRSDMKVGDNVIVSGCGSIGLSVIQAAKLAGAYHLIAFDIVESKRQLAIKAGADYAFDPRSKEDMEKVKEILSHTNGAQVTYEAAGHPTSIRNCISCTMPNGQIMMVGNDGRPFELVTAALGPFQYDLKFTFTYTKEEIHTLFGLMASGKWSVAPYSIEKVPLEAVFEKMEALSKGELEVARVLLMPNYENN